jgi:hypothetical protein
MKADEILMHILNEQMGHGGHGDAEYVSMIATYFKGKYQSSVISDFRNTTWGRCGHCLRPLTFEKPKQLLQCPHCDK